MMYVIMVLGIVALIISDRVFWDNVDLSAIEVLRVVVGLVIMAYVGYCLLNQKVWIRGPIGLFSETYEWGTREENQSIFILHVIAGAAFGIWLAIGPFLF